MWALIGIAAFCLAAIAFETAGYFFDLLPALKRKGIVHGTAAFLGLMALVCLLDFIVRF
jgi:hypothetical protein